jgi:hypothetical protein
MAFTDWHRKNWRHDTYSGYIDPDQVARTKNRGAGFWFGAHEESLKNPLMAVQFYLVRALPVVQVRRRIWVTGLLFTIWLIFFMGLCIFIDSLL